MGFFRDPKSNFGIEIFNFGLDRKISKVPESRGSGPGFEKLEKIPKNPEGGDRDLSFRDIPKRWCRRIFILGIRDFFGIFYLRDIPEIFYPRNRDFFSWDGIPRQKTNSAIEILSHKLQPSGRIFSTMNKIKKNNFENDQSSQLKFLNLVTLNLVFF